MRILATADLHYDVRTSREPTEQLARQVVKAGGDVLILAGDTAGREVEQFGKCLDLFAGFGGRKLLVPGNHCIWVGALGNSWEKYEKTLPQVAGNYGFECLDRQPVLQDGLGFVGTMGWYDYSYRDESLGIPLRFYEHKVAPGAAERLPEYKHLVSGYSDIPAQAKLITARWMDGRWVRWALSDRQVTGLLADQFAKDLVWAAQRADTIVAVTHHLPFGRLVKSIGQPAWRFANAFMGSELFGQAMLAQKKCRLAICGHNHRAERFVVDHLRCVNVGCTYRHKRWLTFDIEPGRTPQRAGTETK